MRPEMGCTGNGSPHEGWRPSSAAVSRSPRGSDEASITLRELRANISPPAADAPAVFKNGQ